MNQPKLSSCDQNWNTTPLKCSDEIERGYCRVIAGLLLAALQTFMAGFFTKSLSSYQVVLLVFNVGTLHQYLSIMSLKTKKIDNEMAEQALECSRIERGPSTKSISDILNIVRLSVSDSAKREQLSASVKRLQYSLFSSFQAEQNVIISSLVTVGRSGEYESINSSVTDTVEAVYEIVDRMSEATVAIQPVPI
ncbi:hypothetical protein QTP88_011775 [Uroleucon formosanum]